MSVLGSFVTWSEFGFPHALTVAFDAVCAVHEAVGKRIRKWGFADDIVPGAEGQLAGNQC